MIRRLPILVEPENLARVLWPEPFAAVAAAQSQAADAGWCPDLATRHLRAGVMSATREAAQLLARLDSAGLEIRHKRIRS